MGNPWRERSIVMDRRNVWFRSMTSWEFRVWLEAMAMHGAYIDSISQALEEWSTHNA